MQLLGNSERKTGVAYARPPFGWSLWVVCVFTSVFVTRVTLAQVGDDGKLNPVPSGSDESAISDEGRVKELGERVEGLKERVHESKSRLLLLKEQILHDVIAEAQVTLVHRNELGASFTIEFVRYTLDGVQIYAQANNDARVLDHSRHFQLFRDTLVPANHVLSVEIVLRGEGGLFSYVDGYRFRIRSNYTFYAPKAKITHIDVVVFENGGGLTTLEDRPAVRYDVRHEDAVAAPAATPEIGPRDSDRSISQ
ncbi:MAG: dihydrolipoamide acetyltransferase [Myxococcales bacterium]|nr:dihydrolipoamide acetyltransferase [Myxococcales bacterium]